MTETTGTPLSAESVENISRTAETAEELKLCDSHALLRQQLATKSGMVESMSAELVQQSDELAALTQTVQAQGQQMADVVVWLKDGIDTCRLTGNMHDRPKSTYSAHLGHYDATTAIARDVVARLQPLAGSATPPQETP